MNPQRLRLVREVDGDYVRSRLETVAEEGDDEDDADKQSHESLSDDDEAVSRGKRAQKPARKRGSKGDIFSSKSKPEQGKSEEIGRVRGPSFSQRFLSMASGNSGGKRNRVGSDGNRETLALAPVLDGSSVSRTASLTDKPRGSFGSAASSDTQGADSASTGLMGAIRKASKSLRLPKGLSFSNPESTSGRGSVTKDGEDADDEISQAVDEIMRARRASAGIEELAAATASGGSDGGTRPVGSKSPPQSGNTSSNVSAEGMDAAPKRSGRYSSTEVRLSRFPPCLARLFGHFGMVSDVGVDGVCAAVSESHCVAAAV
jgi:hypothetical protein